MKTRVISKQRIVSEGRGYVGKRRIYENLLQRKIGPFWFTIDREEIPDHVIISRSSLGYDTSGWRSKFKV